MIFKSLLAAIVLLAMACGPVAAHPRHHHHHITANARPQHRPVARYRFVRHYRDHHARYRPRAQRPSYGRAGIIGGRPHGCPYEYCGCGASLFLFHHIIGALNLAANWLRFPHTHFPQPGDAAVAPSRHHVLVLVRHIRGSLWEVHDSNSGRHLTRDHVRNIAGWTVVAPHRSLRVTFKGPVRIRLELGQ